MLYEKWETFEACMIKQIKSENAIYRYPFMKPLKDTNICTGRCILALFKIKT